MPEKSRQEQIAECVAILAEAFRQRVSETTFQSYDIGLSDLDVGDIKRAVVRAIRECQFMPTVHELRKLCGAGASSIDAKDRPLAAWQAVRDAIRRVGGYDSPNFADPVVNAAIRELGGWVLVCDTPTDEMHWVEKRFCQVYSALAGARLPGHQTMRLAGITEIDNGRSGYRSEPVRVANVACLTADRRQAEPVRICLEAPAPPEQSPGPNDAVRSLSANLPSTEPPAKPKPIAALKPDKLESSPAKTREEQTAELKRLANLRDDQSKAG